jgi:DNA-binding NarL/FixJ family response regulator
VATQPGVPPTRLAVQSSRRLVGETLLAYLSTLPDFVVVGSIAGPSRLVSLCELRRPDVLLLDAETQLADAMAALVVLTERFPAIRAVLLYEQLSTEQIALIRQSGCAVPVPAARGLDALLAELRRRRPPPTGPTARRARLTDRELEIIMLLGSGHSVPEIAALLGITAATVENHKRRIYAKLDARSASHAVARAASLGVVPRSERFQLAGASAVTVTARECDILRSISRGHTVRQTAQSLGIAPKTVENTQARLFGKLGVRNRAGALVAAYTLGLLEPAAGAED